MPPNTITKVILKVVAGCISHGAPVINLLILVFSGKCRAYSSVRLWVQPPNVEVGPLHVELISNRFCRHAFVACWRSFGRAPSVLPCAKVEVAVLLLGCCSLILIKVLLLTVSCGSHKQSVNLRGFGLKYSRWHFNRQKVVCLWLGLKSALSVTIIGR